MAGRNQGGDFFMERSADAADLFEPACGHQFIQVAFQLLESARGIVVGQAPKRILALQLQEGADLIEDRRDLVLVHEESPLSRERGSKTEDQRLRGLQSSISILDPREF